MNHHSFHDPLSESDPALDELFRLRELAPHDFAERTVKAARAKQRRARVVRLSAWTSGLAASIALLLGVGVWQSSFEQPELAAISEPAAGEEELPRGTQAVSAEELTAMLYASLPEDDVVFYGHAQALEDLLAEAGALTDEENLETLDFLILLAHN